LIFGEDPKEIVDCFRPPNFDKVTDYKKSGYKFFFLEESKLKISFDYGEIGDPLTAAHGHSDIFHFWLHRNGEPILIDSGTYQYHSRCAERKYFRSALAHNTISVENMDQAVQNTRMSWLKTPEVTVLQNNNQEISAEHNGFKKQGANCVHKRSLSVKDHGTVIITDTLSGQSNSSFVVSFILGQSLAKYKEHGGEVTCWFKQNKLTIQPTEGTFTEIELTDGFCSSAYDHLEKTKVLRFKGEFEDKVNLSFHLSMSSR